MCSDAKLTQSWHSLASHFLAWGWTSVCFKASRPPSSSVRDSLVFFHREVFQTQGLSCLPKPELVFKV